MWAVWRHTHSGEGLSDGQDREKLTFFFSLRHSKHILFHAADLTDFLPGSIIFSRHALVQNDRCRVCVKQLLVIAPVCFVERTATRCCAKRKLPHYIIMISHSKNCRGCHHSFPIRLHFSMRGGCFLYSKYTLSDLGKPEHFRNGFAGLSNSKTGRVFRILIVIYFLKCCEIPANCFLARLHRRGLALWLPEAY